MSYSDTCCRIKEQEADEMRSRIADLETCRSVLAKIMGDPSGRGIDPEHRRQAHAALAVAAKSDKR
jgi:hypothetical protein